MPSAGARSRVAVCRPFLLSLHEIEQTGGAREIESPWVGSRSIPEPYLAGGYLAGDSRGDGFVVRRLCSRQRRCDLDGSGFRPGSRLGHHASTPSPSPCSVCSATHHL